MIPRKSRGEWYKNKSAWGREKSAVSVFGLLKNRAAGYGGAWRVSKGRTRAPAWRLERTLKALAEAISHRVARKKKKKKCVLLFSINKDTRCTKRLKLQIYFYLNYLFWNLFCDSSNREKEERRGSLAKWQIIVIR